MRSAWLFSPRTDLAVFFGAAMVSAALAAGGTTLGIDETPLWAWVLLVLCIDVAHVWSTLFRVYLDGEELRRRPRLYFAAPVACWLLGVLAYEAGVFWRVLAYAAAWHFIRQQAGWMALYGRRAGSPRWRVRLDAAAVYAVTLGPVVWWHAHLPRRFWWFVEGDFVGGLPAWCGTVALGVMAAAVLVWGVAWSSERHWGKALLLFATWLAWFGGIVVAQSDFAFTVMNVVLHGVPYVVLTWTYSRGRAADGAGYGRWAWLLRGGWLAFASTLLVLSFFEEALWDKLVWHERGALFGGGGLELGGVVLALVVPLLALPQATHYVLDAFVWRGRENPRLGLRLGWGSS